MPPGVGLPAQLANGRNHVTMPKVPREGSAWEHSGPERAARTGAPAVVAAVLVAAGFGLPPCLALPPIVIFDEGDVPGVDYYDASFGQRGASSVLRLAGPGGDKLPLVTGRASSGSQCGLLQWTSGAAARWRMFVSSPSWHTLDASAYESLALTVNGPAAIESADLPWIGLESKTNQKSCPVSLATYLPRGLDADPTTWQGISIPLEHFQGCGAFALSELKAVWFRQGASDTVQRAIWFDEVRLIPR